MSKIKLNVYLSLLVCATALSVLASTASASPNQPQTTTVALHGTHFGPSLGHSPTYYHYYPYYRSDPYVPYYRVDRYTYRYRYSHPHRGAYNYGFFLHNLPRHYFYPKYDHDNDYYSPSVFGTPYPTAPSMRVNYAIGDGPAAADGPDGVTIRIVSRIEPTKEIDERIASGRLLLESGEYEGASKYFLKAMALSPSSVEARTLYARACAADGRWTAASFALKRAVARDTQLERVIAILSEDASETAATRLALQNRIENGSADDSAIFVYGILCAADGRGYEAKLIFARLRVGEGECREAATVAQWLETRFPAKPRNA